MTSRQPARRVRIRWLRVVGLITVVGAIAAAGEQVLASSTSTAAPPLPLLHLAQHRHHHRLGEADGAVPAGTTVFSDDVPGVNRLDPALLRALREAATDAGLPFVVNSGWRSAAYEDHLRRAAVAKYGSEAEAARWVATGTTSPHVAGDAVDLGPAAATQWLSAHGAGYGLCQIYANEPWHYELRPEARERGCPAMYADPTQDPRMKEHP